MDLTLFDRLFRRNRSHSDTTKVHPQAEADIDSIDEIQAARIGGVVAGATAATVAGTVATVGVGAAMGSAGVAIGATGGYAAGRAVEMSRTEVLAKSVKESLKFIHKYPWRAAIIGQSLISTIFGIEQTVRRMHSKHAEMFLKASKRKSEDIALTQTQAIKERAAQALADGTVNTVKDALQYAKKKVLHEAVLVSKELGEFHCHSVTGVEWFQEVADGSTKVQRALDGIEAEISQQALSMQKHGLERVFVKLRQLHNHLRPVDLGKVKSEQPAHFLDLTTKPGEVKAEVLHELQEYFDHTRELTRTIVSNGGRVDTPNPSKLLPEEQEVGSPSSVVPTEVAVPVVPIEAAPVPVVPTAVAPVLVPKKVIVPRPPQCGKAEVSDVVELSAFALYAKAADICSSLLQSEVLIQLCTNMVLLFAIRAICAYAMLLMERQLGYTSLDFAEHFTECKCFVSNGMKLVAFLRLLSRMM